MKSTILKLKSIDTPLQHSLMMNNQLERQWESGTLMRRLANQTYDIWVKKREESVMKRTLCHRDRYV